MHNTDDNIQFLAILPLQVGHKKTNISQYFPEFAIVEQSIIWIEYLKIPPYLLNKDLGSWQDPYTIVSYLLFRTRVP